MNAEHADRPGATRGGAAGIRVLQAMTVYTQDPPLTRSYDALGLVAELLMRPWPLSAGESLRLNAALVRICCAAADKLRESREVRS